MAMHLNPYSAEVLGTIGVFYMQLGNLDFARQALEQALLAAPDDPWILVHLAEVLLRTGAEEDTAREHLERVVNVAPDSSWASTARKYLQGLAETAPTR
jgi:cytochrome c-type biogenesis protein CcmH/NrfG